MQQLNYYFKLMSRVIKIKCLIVFILVLISLQSFSQVDFTIRRKRLNPILFDTASENSFIYEVPNAFIYFRQKDILEFINNPLNQSILKNYGYKYLQDALLKGIKQIKIKDVLFNYDQVQRESILKQDGITQAEQKINEELYFIAAGLMLKGSFMVYSKSKTKFITARLIAKTVTGYLGQKNLVFYLPDGTEYYSIITVLGE